MTEASETSPIRRPSKWDTLREFIRRNPPGSREAHEAAQSKALSFYTEKNKGEIPGYLSFNAYRKKIPGLIEQLARDQVSATMAVFTPENESDFGRLAAALATNSRQYDIKTIYTPSETDANKKPLIVTLFLSSDEESTLGAIKDLNDAGISFSAGLSGVLFGQDNLGNLEKRAREALSKAQTGADPISVYTARQLGV